MSLLKTYSISTTELLKNYNLKKFYEVSNFLPSWVIHNDIIIIQIDLQKLNYSQLINGNIVVDSEVVITMTTGYSNFMTYGLTKLYTYDSGLYRYKITHDKGVSYSEIFCNV